MSRIQTSLWAALIAAAVVSCIHPPFPRQMLLQHFPTVAVLVALPPLMRRYPVSNGAFACVIAFMLLHVLGARYIYSYVPYDEWSEQLFGVSLARVFHLRRNHYDRVVHLAFGLLAPRPFREVQTRYLRVPSGVSRYFAIEFVLAFSMLYELFEWGLTMVLSPGDAGAYNGEQGDIWTRTRTCRSR
jgi:putative membrane protein